MYDKNLEYISRIQETEILDKIAALEETIRVMKDKEAQFYEIIGDLVDFECKIDAQGSIIQISSTKHFIKDYYNQGIVGRNILEFVHPDDRKLFLDNFNCLAAGGRFKKLVGRLMYINGSYIYIEVVGMRAQCCSEINSEMILYCRYVPDTYAMEEVLRKSEEQYEKLVELFPEAIVISIGGKIEYCNMAAIGLVGAQSEKQMFGKSVLDFVCNDYREHVRDDIVQATALGSNSSLREWELIRLDNKKINVESMSMTIPYYNKTALLTVIHDITERKITEELKAKIDENRRLLIEVMEYDNLKTDLFSNISHELRTPLNVILGILQTFGLMFTDENMKFDLVKIHKFTNIMRQNCYRLLRLVNNLIDITRIDAGFYNIKLNNCNIVSIVEDIVLSVAEYTAQKGIKLIFDTDIEEKYTACDPDKIERIMLNLLSNAIKFTNPGGTIIVYVEDENDKIKINVKDNGVGIPEEKLTDIFERFRQVEKSFVRYHQGSGIGLFLVKSLVKLHDGNILVESKVNEGSKFTIELPTKLTERQEEESYSICANHSRIEMINIEFSDIYSN